MIEKAIRIDLGRLSGGAVYAAFINHTLQENGIENVIEAEGDVTGHSATIGPRGRFEILVRQEDEERARELLAGLEQVLASEEEEIEPEPTANKGLQSLTERGKRWFLYLAVVFGAAAVGFGVLAFRRGGDVSAMSIAIGAAFVAVLAVLSGRGPR